MSDPRSARPTLEVRPRFRCLVCRVFVTGTDDGVCPRCGWQPPSLTRCAKLGDPRRQTPRSTGATPPSAAEEPLLGRPAPAAVPTWIVLLVIVAALAIGALVAVGV